MNKCVPAIVVVFILYCLPCNVAGIFVSEAYGKQEGDKSTHESDKPHENKEDSKHEGGKHEDSKPSSKGKESVKNTKENAFVALDEFVVDLVSTGHKNNFLRMKIVLELTSHEYVTLIDENVPRIRDICQVYLHGLYEDDFRGSAGLENIREQLIARINKVVYPAKVENVLFSQVIVN